MVPGDECRGSRFPPRAWWGARSFPPAGTWASWRPAEAPGSFWAADRALEWLATRCPRGPGRPQEPDEDLLRSRQPNVLPPPPLSRLGRRRRRPASCSSIPCLRGARLVPGRAPATARSRRPRTSARGRAARPAEGFRYWSLGVAGSLMSDGRPTPRDHDGMAAFAHGQEIRIVRNHELTGPGPAFGPPDRAYDPEAPGGTTTILFDPKDPQQSRAFASLSGTSTNCAGGPTPWGSWLTCEEVFTETTADGRALRHGYVFEVPSGADDAVKAMPLRASDDSSTRRWRWIRDRHRVRDRRRRSRRLLPLRAPTAPGARRRPAADAGHPGAAPGYRTSAGQRVGPGPMAWVDVAQPDPGRPAVLPRAGRRPGGGPLSPARRRVVGPPRSRGLLHRDDGGEATAGQVWAFRPGPDGGTLTLVYESPARDALMQPDNVTVSPSGGSCSAKTPTASARPHLRGLTKEGVVYTFADNISSGPSAGRRCPRSSTSSRGAASARTAGGSS